MKTAYSHAKIVTVNEAFDVLEDGLMIEEDGKISYVGPFQSSLLESCDQEIDYTGAWMMPGLVNVHTHTAMTLLRGIQDDTNLHEWLTDYIWPAEATFTSEQTELAVQVALLEMLKSGTTTFNDMYNPSGVSISKIYQQVKASGMRCFFSPTLFSSLAETSQETLDRTQSIIEDILSYKDERFQVMVAPHAPYSCERELLEGSLALAKTYRIPVHIHVAETEEETKTILEKYGMRPIAYLKELGFLDYPAIFAHGVELTHEEVKLLAQSPVSIAHNPVSNLKLASGVAPVLELLKNGVTVGLATDSSASNNNLDLFEEVRTASLLQKMAAQDASQMTVEMALRLMTIEGAKALHMEDRIGSIEVGKEADFLVIRPQGKPHLYPVEKALSHLIYAARGADVSDVYIAGTCVVRNGQVLTLPEKAIFQQLEMS